MDSERKPTDHGVQAQEEGGTSLSGPWVTPPGMAGDANLIRIGVGTVGDEEYTCPAFAAAKARPAVAPAHRPRWPKGVLEQFALAPVKEALDDVEFGNLTIEAALEKLRRRKKALHPGHLTYADAAVRAYLMGTATAGAPVLVPVSDTWVAQKSNDKQWEHYAWGRQYQSPDGQIREQRLLRQGRVGDRERDRAQIAIAAYAAAFGGPAPWPEPERWKQPFAPREATAVSLARITEIGLLDGSQAVLFEGTPTQAQAYYAEHGRARVTQIAAGGPAKPGSSCAGCKMVTVCKTLIKAPGLLGLTANNAPLRQVSVSDLRYYRRCPAQTHLRSLHLPKNGEYGPTAIRGKAIHAHLGINHANPLRVPCNAYDVAVDPDGWSAGGFTLTGEQSAVGARMLAHHVDVCPLDSAEPISEVLVEPTLALYDTAANAVVLASPDLLYREGASWIWHETKTTEKDAWYHDDMLDEFPQLALGMLILARGLLGGDPAGSRVELETLREKIADPDLDDPTNPARVAKAQEVIRTMAQPWREDQLFPASPGPVCRTCPVSRWCPSYVEDTMDNSEAGPRG